MDAASGSSNSGKNTLEQWKDQIEVGFKIIRDGARGFNREIRKLDSSSLRDSEITEFDKNRFGDSWVYCRNDSDKPEKRGIKSISIKSLNDPSKAVYKIGDYSLDPNKPMDMSIFSSVDRKRKLENSEIRECLYEVKNVVGEILSGQKNGVRRLKKAIENTKSQLAAATSVSQPEVLSNEFKLPGQPDFETFLKNKVIDVIEHPDAYSRFGIDFPQSVLLFGTPGCGKTSAIKKLAEASSLSVFEVDMASVGSSYLHATAKKIESIFEQAKQSAPSIVIIDEADTLMSESRKTAEHTGEEVAVFLKWMNEAADHKILVVGMTNSPDALSGAAKRAGRFTHHFEVKPFSSAQQIEELLRSIFDQKCISADVSLTGCAEYLAKKPSCSVADVYAFSKSILCEAGLQRLLDIDQEFLDKFIEEQPDPTV